LIQKPIYSWQWTLAWIALSTLATIGFSLVYGAFALMGWIVGVWIYVALGLLLAACAAASILMFRTIARRGLFFYRPKSN